ncbi:MAG: hypothetical protein ABSB35_03025 [Bryobacteraceae bacterium]|jgi:hypothetical protein
MRIGHAKSIPALLPDGWVRVEQVRKTSTRLEVGFAVHIAGRGGSKTGAWSVICQGVRETHLTDFNGGGLAVYPASHPAARQYTAQRAVLRWLANFASPAILGALYQAHSDAVDDWIPFDRYVDIESGKCVCRGPDFLMRAYAKALRAQGERPLVTPLGTKKSKSAKLGVLHFGESFVVAAKFTAERVL